MQAAKSIFIFFGLSTVFLCQTFGQQVQAIRGSTHFHVDKNISHAIKIPKDIFSKLDGSNENWYKACYVDIGIAKGKGILVQGNDGASTTGFWIFIKRGDSWDLILQERGLDLTIKPAYKNGLRKIEVVGCWVYGCRHREYEFNGKEYIPCSCYDETDNGIKGFTCPERYNGPWPTVAR